ncbi:MAG: ferritin-like domain-containing protein [Rhodospirillaceae bacterium]
MLAEASELEHAALCSYLFAAFSLKRSTEEGLTARELRSVTEWRKTLFAIARDEMAHLVTVNNLIVAIGGSAHFNRPNFPVAPNYFPGGFTLELAPFGKQALERFIALERSERAVEDLEEDRAWARGAPADFLFPAAVDYRSIGAFYEELKRTIEYAAAELGEEKLFVRRAAQLAPRSAKLDNSFVIEDLASARKAIDTIVEEGEGAAGGAADCHYARFSRIKEEFESLRAQNPGFEPARPVVCNPVMRAPAPDHAARVRYVSADEARPILDAANAIYGQLLRCLVQAYASRDSAPRSDSLVAVAVSLMHVFSEVSSHLTTLPASAGSADRAGVTFTMLRSIEPLARESVLISERLAEIARRLDQLQPAEIFAAAAARVRDAAVSL